MFQWNKSFLATQVRLVLIGIVMFASPACSQVFAPQNTNADDLMNAQKTKISELRVANFTAPAISPSSTHSYSQSATNDFLQKIAAILNYRSLKNPKFLENTLGVKFDVFPENYGPGKEVSLSDFLFRAGKFDYPGNKYFGLGVTYRVYVSSINRLQSDEPVGNLIINFDIPDVCVSVDAFDSFFDTPRQDKGRTGLPSGSKGYWFDKTSMDKNYDLNFSLGVNWKTNCISRITITQTYDHSLPPKSQVDPLK